MSRTTGPILALGATTVINRTVFNGQPMDWRIPIATGLAAIGFSLLERAFPDGADVLAWTALTTTLVTRVEAGVPSPVESAVAWWKNSKSAGGAEAMPQATGGGGSAGSMEV